MTCPYDIKFPKNKDEIFHTKAAYEAISKTTGIVPN